MLVDAHIHLMPDKRMASGIRWVFNNYAPATQFLSQELDTPAAAAELDSCPIFKISAPTTSAWLKFTGFWSAGKDY